ncbi:tumor necrosis factor receptor superfamily member 23 [Synchiropus splendidus]|uniref:tumor necrosis factor receptor superfamily member 23 n=1 Tax=Synchiropus splendidus TaxID=270530 RepID=UPI00237D9F9E|nr:tumor necrosis factor receptor superfamily member 23 [Synchiropus splendidus]
MLSFIPLIPLFVLSFPPSVSSLTCLPNQYLWPQKSPSLCCDKCPPGQRMLRRSETTCLIQCEACTTGLYTDKYNTEMSCSVCRRCNKPNMEYGSQCSSTRGAVCTCKHGHKCKDPSCSWCVAAELSKPHIITTAAQPGDMATTNALMATSTITVSISQPHETWWHLVIVLLFGLGVTVFISIKIQPLMCWLKSQCRPSTRRKPVGQCPVEDDNLSLPIQEMGDASRSICLTTVK